MEVDVCMRRSDNNDGEFLTAIDGKVALTDDATMVDGNDDILTESCTNFDECVTDNSHCQQPLASLKAGISCSSAENTDIFLTPTFDGSTLDDARVCDRNASADVTEDELVDIQRISASSNTVNELASIVDTSVTAEKDMTTDIECVVNLSETDDIPDAGSAETELTSLDTVDSNAVTLSDSCDCTPASTDSIRLDFDPLRSCDPTTAVSSVDSVEMSLDSIPHIIDPLTLSLQPTNTAINEMTPSVQVTGSSLDLASTSGMVLDVTNLVCSSAEPAAGKTPPEMVDIDAKKRGFRVRFHEEHVVTGYLDPPTPWREVDQCSTSELVSAYRDSCRQMGVKPMAKLVQQLEAIGSFEDRHELLSLKGESIDTKMCETLEEIFRRVRFRSIDIEATSLDEETAVIMFDLLDYYESCQRLNISYNKNLGIRGWQACARFIKKTACLEMLEARGCSFTDPAMTMIGRSLRLGSHVKVLHLENSFLSGRPLMLLVAAVKFNETLCELFLADNKLTPSDGVQLGSLLKTNRALCLLDVRNNLLQDVGLAHICDGVLEQGSRSSLSTLVVWNNQVTYESMTAVSRALVATKALETINLGHNNITNEGIHRLKDGLLQNKSLLRIGLQSAKLTCEGAVALAEFIAETSMLLRIDLRGNHIRTGGLMALMLALKVNQSVTRVDLDPEPKKEAGVKDYAEQQRRLLSDIASFTARNLAILAGLSPADGSKQLENSGATSASIVAPPSPSDILIGPGLSENAALATDETTEAESPPVVPVRPTLTLPKFPARSQTLESPAYIPSEIDAHFAAQLASVAESASELPAADNKPAVTNVDASLPSVAENRPTNLSVPLDTGTAFMNVMSPSDLSTSPVNLSPVVEPTPAPPAPIDVTPVAPPLPKSTGFAATVRRKFTVSKAVLPSTAASKPSSSPVVVFTKSVADTDKQLSSDGIDDSARVRFVEKSSAVTAVTSSSKVTPQAGAKVEEGSTQANPAVALPVDSQVSEDIPPAEQADDRQLELKSSHPDAEVSIAASLERNVEAIGCLLPETETKISTTDQGENQPVKARVANGTDPLSSSSIPVATGTSEFSDSNSDFALPDLISMNDLIPNLVDVTTTDDKTQNALDSSLQSDDVFESTPSSSNDKRDKTFRSEIPSEPDSGCMLSESDDGSEALALLRETGENVMTSTSDISSLSSNECLTVLAASDVSRSSKVPDAEISEVVDVFSAMHCSNGELVNNLTGNKLLTADVAFGNTSTGNGIGRSSDDVGTEPKDALS